MSSIFIDLSQHHTMLTTGTLYLTFRVIKMSIVIVQGQQIVKKKSHIFQHSSLFCRQRTKMKATKVFQENLHKKCLNNQLDSKSPVQRLI